MEYGNPLMAIANAKRDAQFWKDRAERFEGQKNAACIDRDGKWIALKAANARIDELVAALRAMSCYGCSTTPGDNSPDTLKRSRGCVTCRTARAAIAKAEGR